MMNRALPLLLLSVVLITCGCETARRFYLASVYRMVRVPTENMNPTIQPGDYAAIDESYYKANPIRRFDLVMFKNPAMGLSGQPPDTMYIKRIIALGGEKIEIKDGGIYIDDKRLIEPHVTMPFEPEENDFAAVVVPSGECYLLGDNRSNSFDSRYWEKPTLDNELIVGKVVEIISQ